jgi:hypothetical protein
MILIPDLSVGYVAHELEVLFPRVERERGRWARRITATRFRGTNPARSRPNSPVVDAWTHDQEASLGIVGNAPAGPISP